MGRISKRHYVSASPGWWRSYSVMTQSYVNGPRSIHIKHVVVARRFTWKGAQKLARRLNAREGIAQ